MDSNFFTFLRCMFQIATTKKLDLEIHGAISNDGLRSIYGELPSNGTIRILMNHSSHNFRGRLSKMMLPSPTDCSKLTVESFTIQNSAIHGALPLFWNRSIDLRMKYLKVQHCEITDLFLPRLSFSYFKYMDFSSNKIKILHARSLIPGPETFVYDNNPIDTIRWELNSGRGLAFRNEVRQLYFRNLQGPLDAAEIFSYDFLQLQIIDFSGTPLIYSSSRVQGIFPKLNSIRLSACDIHHQTIAAMENIFLMPNLQQIDLSRNERLETLNFLSLLNHSIDLLDLSYSIFRFYSTKSSKPWVADVRVVDLSQAKAIDILPTQMFGPSLEELYMGNFQVVDRTLTPLSDSIMHAHYLNSSLFRKLPRLRKLDLSGICGCHLGKRPFIESSNLYHIDLSNIDLDSAHLQSVLENLPASIRYLNLHNTTLTESMLNSVVLRCPNLEQLNISRTSVSALSALKYLSDLQVLDISYTPVRSLEPIIDALLMLKTLIANHISELREIGGPGRFSRHHFLHKLSLTHSKLTAVAADMFHHVPLHQLTFSGHKHLRKISKDTLYNQTSLVELTLRDNAFELPSIPPVSLQLLDISGAVKIKNTLQVLPHFHHLLFLDISNGQLTSIDNDFHFPFLVALNLSSNSFTGHLPSVLFRMPVLTHLFASSNLFTKLSSRDLCRFPYLSHLDMRNNKFKEIADDKNTNFCFSLNAPHSTFGAIVSFSNNPELTNMDGLFHAFQNRIFQLDVSGNRNLRLTQDLSLSNQLSNMKVLDISRTRSDLTDGWCERHDRLEVLIARGLIIDSVPSNVQIDRFLSACFRLVRMLDVSNNANLITLKDLRLSIGSIQFPQLRPIQQSQLHASPSKYLTRLELNGLHATCTIRETTIPTDFVVGNVRSAYANPAFMYQCDCIPGFRETSGTCEEKQNFVTIIITVAVTLSVVLVIIIAFKFIRCWRRVQYDLDLRAQLISEKELENLQLREAWEARAEDLQLIERIDKESPGTYSEVWRGTWLDQNAAIKILKATMIDPFKLDDDDQKFSPAFRREVEFLMVLCRHKNIVQFMGAGHMIDGSPFILLEYAPNGSLDVYLGTCCSFEFPEQRPTPPVVEWRQRLWFARGISAGMAHIHAKGVMHRDLKTANVLVSSTLEPKIADFGNIRKLYRAAGLSSEKPVLVDAKANMTSSVGTPLYMAKEVFLGDCSYTAAADVWSFGVCLWEIASQRPPLLFEELGLSSRGPFMIRFQKALQEGKRLPIESNWPEWVCGLLLRCWDDDWTCRPTFWEIFEICQATCTESF
eukprot:gene8908-1251_t